MPDVAKAYVGAREVLASGSVVVSSTERFRCSLQYSGETITFAFAFDTNTLDPAPKIQIDAVSSDSGIVTLTNFHNPLGVGNAEPIIMGTIGGKQIFLAIVVHSLLDKGYILNYTFLLADPP